MHVEAGPDAIWCGAAAEWAAHQNATSRPACAVITVPVAHDDTRSLVARSAAHVSDSFHLLWLAKIRHPLRWSLGGDEAKCHRHNCSRHPWFLFSPSPNWHLPTDEQGLRQVHACAVAREDGAGVGTCAAAPSESAVGRPLTQPRLPCDGMTSLYWSTHEY